jgi:UDP-2,3-diacylglucosamine pyrophosphatase LpxH
LKVQDTLIANLSDFQTGSSTALFLNRFWQDEWENHTPTERQKEIYKVYERCMEFSGKVRKNKRLIVVQDGDAIEGWHHNSLQICVHNKDSQAEIHEELMDSFLRRSKFSKKDGDKLFYIRGTETHTEEKENEIGKDLGAEKSPEGFYTFDHLELMVNGRRIWYVHHGKKRGTGANEGNALRNWLRDIYYDCEKVGAEPPDIVISGHVHSPTYTNHVVRRGNGFHVMHGVICPSWQEKTRFAYKVAPVERNEVGAVFVEITAAGDIRVPTFILKETDKVRSVRV